MQGVNCMTGICGAANKEWSCVKAYFIDSIKGMSEYVHGEYFETQINGRAVLVCKLNGTPLVIIKGITDPWQL